ncbi:MAG: cold-shock protein [Bacteroidota bacterium]
MGRKNQNAFIKKQKEELKRKKRAEKKELMEERRSQPKSGKLEDMMAYIDENGNIVSGTPGDNEEKDQGNQ